MVKLNDRLQRIAERIANSETMADIGCDHGFLPIYLREKGICSRVILADISVLSLEKAKENFRQFSTVREGVSFRVGNGLSVLQPGEADAVVIAGMGGKLIRDILAADLERTCSFRKFVFQPRIGQGYLRKWLLEHDFAIISEDVAIEGNYVPEIITALSPGHVLSGQDLGTQGEQERTRMMRIAEAADAFRGQAKAMDGEDMPLRMPSWLVYAAGPVEAFLDKNIALQQEILEQVKLSRKGEPEREKLIGGRIAYMEALKAEYAKRKEQTDGR